MLQILITILSILITLLLNELWWRKKHPNDEISRKVVHILVGSFAAFWPYYLSWAEIELLGLSFIVVVLISKYFKIFQAIHSVQRPTAGELFFGLSVTLVALLTHDKLIFMTAILSMGLADGVTGIVGSYFGKTTNYRIFGHTKSIVGSLTFYVICLILLINYFLHSQTPNHAAYYLILAFVATALENLSIRGLDNLTIPLLFTITLKLLS